MTSDQDYALARPKKALQPIVLTIVALACIFAGFVAWAISSPVAGSPDDDYHLGSIWCPEPVESSGCRYTTEEGSVTQVEVPQSVGASAACFAFHPEINASCTLTLSDDQMMPTERFDQGAYPRGFYQFHHVFVGHDVDRSVIVMRIVNIMLGLGGVIAVGILARPHRRHHLLIATMAAWSPMGVYFIASNNPSTWAISGTLIYAVGMIVTLDSSGRRRWISLGVATLGALLAAFSRPDSAFFVFVTTLAIWLLIPTIRFRKVEALWSVALSLLGLGMFLSTSQASALTADGGWPVDHNASMASVFVHNLLTIPEYIVSLWGIGSGPGWFDVPLLGWSTYAMVFLAGGIWFIGIQDLHRQKTLASIVVAGALIGIPVVNMTMRHVYPVNYYQGRYMLPLLAVFFFIWLVRRGDRVFFSSPSQLIPLVLIANVAHSLALYQVIKRYAMGLPSANGPVWWPWDLGSLKVWLLGSLAMFAGTSLLAFLSYRSVKIIDVPSESDPRGITA